MKETKRYNHTTNVAVNLDNNKDNITIKGLPTKGILIAESLLSKQQQHTQQVQKMCVFLLMTSYCDRNL